ncbi:MAG: SOS response-associated peptidase [Alphaproteobacteria bacterium]
MTGRFFRREISWDDYRAAIDLVPPPGVDAPEGQFNIAPSQPCPILKTSRPGLYEGDYAPHGATMVLPAFWGLIPAWAGPRATFGEKPFSSFNARADQVADSPVFSGTFRHGRCLVPASGFYAWSNGTPFAFALRDAPWFCCAGLWSRAMVDGSEFDTFAIITTEANAVVAGLSASMPAILDRGQCLAWLDDETRDHLALLRPYPGDAMRGWPANPAVGNVRNQGIELLG